jgi:outer membrane lipoprotein carrier protein
MSLKCPFRLGVVRALSLPLLFVWLTVAQGAQQTAIESLNANLAGMVSLSADVEQLIIEADGGILEESVIRMLLKRPDGFYWETVEPYAELLVTNGVWLWSYQPDLEQVVIEPWNKEESELAAQLLSGDTGGLSAEYEIASLASDSREVSEFLLTPRVSTNINRRVSLSFTSSRLDSIVVEARNGQRTVWRFVNVVLNPQIEDEVFQFEIPEGIEVIENSYGQ